MQTVIKIDPNQKFLMQGFGVVILLAILMYAGSYFSMAQIWWRSGTFTHGFFILPISLYMVWYRRHQLQYIPVKIDYTALIFVVLTGIVWLLAELASVVVIKQLCATAWIPLTVWFLFGRQMLLALSFPLVYLFFSVPVGEFLVPKLQDVTAWFSVWGLEFINMPVYWEGRYISIPSGDFVVAEACSGIRYLIASVALGCLYAYISYESIYRRLAFIALSVIVPIFANAIRAFGIIMIAHLSDMRLATGIDHFVYGWLFFGLVMFLLFWLGNLFREKRKNKEKAEEQQTSILTDLDRKGVLRGASFLLLLLAIWPAMALMAQLNQLPEKDQLNLPKQIGDWQGASDLHHAWKPNFIRASHESFASYQRSGQEIMLYVVYYGSQNQDAELVNSENKLYDDNWRRLREDKRVIELGNRSQDLHITVLRRGNQKLLISHYYQIAENYTINKIMAKLYEAKNRITLQSSGSYMVALAAPFEVGEEEAIRAIESFLQEGQVALKRMTLDNH